MFEDLRFRLRALFHSESVEQDLDEELRYHYERQVEHLQNQGHMEAEARRLARLEFGTLDQRKEECRDVNGISWYETLYREFRQSARSLLRRPGFSLGVVFMLALGIGGNLALFSVFNGLFLKPLPIDRPEEIVDINTAAPRWNLERTSVNYFDFHNWRSHNRSFAAMACYDETEANVAFTGEPLRLRGLQVTHDMPQVLRIQPALGRFFSPDEDKPNANRVALISHRIWREQYGSNPSVLGQGIRLDGQGFQIVGVLPSDLRLPIEADFWTPLGEAPVQRQNWYLDTLGRLKPEMTSAKATEDLLRIHKSVPDEMSQLTFPFTVGIRERTFGEMKSYSLIVLAGVGIVLLIACVNVAGLMLVRAQSRRHEMAIRAALGASRWQLSREWLAEAIWLAAAGAAAGILLGLGGLRLIVSLIPDTALPAWVSFEADWRFALLSLVLAATSALFFGAFPALRASRAALRNELAESATRSSASNGQRRSLNGLVIAEVALASVLLVSAVFLGKALWDLSQVQPGFRAENTLVYTVSLPRSQYAKPEQWVNFYSALIEKTRTLPGVRSAAVSSITPLSGHQGNFYLVEGAAPLPKGQSDPVVLRITASPGYLAAAGLTLAEGRDFEPNEGSAPENTTVLVNESFARLYWNKTSPLGKRISQRSDKPKWMNIVGVVKDWKHYGLDRPMRPAVILPQRAAPAPQMSVIVNTASDPLTLARASRELVRQLDSQLPVFRLTTMEERLSRSLWIRRTYSWILGLFAGLALILAVAGLYGVVSYTVALREREIGIRLALGAAPVAIARQVVWNGALLVAAGLALGAVASYFAARSLASLLTGIDPANFWIYAAVGALLLLVALAANLWPARRAARLDPVSIMRSE